MIGSIHAPPKSPKKNGNTLPSVAPWNTARLAFCSAESPIRYALSTIAERDGNANPCSKTHCWAFSLVKSSISSAASLLTSDAALTVQPTVNIRFPRSPVSGSIGISAVPYSMLGAASLRKPITHAPSIATAACSEPKQPPVQPSPISAATTPAPPETRPV